MQATVSLPNVRELHWDFFIQPDVDADRHHYPLSLEQLGQLAYMIVRQALAFRKAEGHTWHKIASLTIPSTRREHRISILVPLLHSELFELQALQIPSTDRYLHDEALESAIRMYCPKVKLLTCPPFTVENNELDNACAVVRACSKLQRFRAGDWGESGSSHGRLSTLVEHHAETLEEIEIVSSTYVSSRDQQAILASCKRLTRFWIVVDSVVGGLQFDDILSKEWVCIEMRELFLKLDRYDFQEEDRPPVCVDIVRQDSYNTPDEHCQGQKDLDDLSPQLLVRRRSSTTDQRSARRVYKQIGRLVGLQFVALAVHTQERPAHATARFAWDLTMRTGHLPELKGLKRLTHLHMADDLWTNMGQDEVEFMEAEWPVLVEVSFEMRTREDEFQALVKESHWRWLQGRRPTLHYLNLTMKTRKHHQHI
ncbi:hypothetical protein BGX28_006390 [Mortierella sp. GBA30]|nr:hypothetical protein BGX28_006390 [Mortierella sp. GBA30]